MLKGKYGRAIIRMQFVRLFIVWMMTKNLILEILKSWDVCFVTCMLLIQTQKEENDL
jgi:hypothetical protein